MSRARARTLVRRFWRTAGSRKALLAEAAFFLALSRAALVGVPFRRIARRLGTLVAPSALPVQAGRHRLPDQAHIATDVGWAVTAAARHLPFKAVCLPQAIAAKLMLERRGVACILHLGAATHTPSVERL